MPTPIKLSAIVETVIEHTDTVKSLILKPQKKCPNFKPGQFMHIAIDEYEPGFNWPESRVFSIANSPTRRELLKMTFAIKGEFTRRLFNEVRQGSTIWVKLPYGSLQFPENYDGELYFIAGGTGITPFLAHLEYAIDKEHNTPISLCYGIRTPENLIFDSILYECYNKLEHFNCRIFIENGVYVKGFEHVQKGILSIQPIYEKLAEIPNPIFYLSGPPQMIHNFNQTLRHWGVPKTKIIVDNWE